MTVDGRVYSGKNAREEAGESLIKIIMASLWEDRGEGKLKERGFYKGFRIMSSATDRVDGIPYLYLRGKQTYEANLNTENALGTIASIEHALHRLDRFAEEEQAECERMEKALVDYMEQLNRPFEHEERLRELVLQQQEINRALDLDKGDNQVVSDETPQKDTNADTNTEPLPTRRTAYGPDPLEAEITVQRIAEAVGE